MSSSGALAVEESEFTKLKKKVESALSSTIYDIYPTAFPALAHLNWLPAVAVMILSFVQIIPFFVHGYGYGSYTTTWGRFARYLQLQIKLTTWASFTAAFWASFAITLLILINAGIVFRSYYKNNEPNPIAVKTLFYSFNIALRILFPAGFKLLATPWWCNPATQKLFPFEQYGEAIDCWGSSNVAYLIIGTITAIILIGLMLISTVAYVNLLPVPLDLFVTVSPIYNISFYSIIIFMTINEYLIGQIIGTWWEALFNWIAITILPGVLIYYLPYQNRHSNSILGALTFALWWSTAVTFVVANNMEYNLVTSRFIDFALIFGMIPFALLGYYAIQYRYLVFQALATGLCQEIEAEFESKELYLAKFTTKKSEESIEGAKRNPYLYLPQILQKFGADTTSVEIIGRLLWFNTSDKLNVEAAYRLYRMADSAFPDLAIIRIRRASCLMTLSVDSSAFIDLLETALNLETSYFIRFLISKRIKDSKQSVSIAGDVNSSITNLNQFGDFQKYYVEAQKYNSVAIKAISVFWSLFLNPEIKISKFLEASKAVDSATNKALATYKSLIVRFPKQLYILSSYAYFLELVMKNGEEAERYHRRAEQLRAREHDDSGIFDGGIDSRAVISINEEGTIEQVNKAVTNLFGWLRSELITRNIKLLVPSPYRERHDQFLDKYKATGNAKVIGHPPRALFGLHRLGYGFPLMLSLQEKRKETGERIFVGTLVAVPVSNDEGQIIISEDGTIIMISKSIEHMFGYKAAEVFRANITVFMLDAYAANHESYLRRYKETGEARVIGTAGRNVPGRRKDGSVVPISLTVTEEYVGSDRFYSAVIRDTSNLTAVVFIDGFGMIQNVDSGVTSLLGYRKEDIMGMNIKNIMPPPYNMFHDLFLERYRRTKVSNILRSVEGRTLPAIHSDGSIVQIRAIIQKSETGNDDNLLFKGLIRRLDTMSSASKIKRMGFDDNCVLELKKDGTIISVNEAVFKMLGYMSENIAEEYIGQPIETLIPPINGNNRQDKNYWMPLALSNTDLNFYILMVTKSYGLFPVTFALSMKSSEVILMRVRDLTTTDAVVSIDDLGTILTFNEDGHILLGFDADEIMGKNIKCIMHESIAANHDGYLQRYNDTRVARVVGIPRVISTIHRDGSTIPIEIQVAEIQNSDGNSFIGRIRHVSIENRMDRAYVDSLFIRSEKAEQLEDQNMSLNVPTSYSHAPSKSGSNANLEPTTQSDSSVDESSSSGEDSDEENSVDESLVKSIESKLAYIKNTTKIDGINRSFMNSVFITFVIYISTFVIALISLNSLPKFDGYLVFSELLLDQGREIYDAIYSADVVLLEEISNDILSNMTQSHISQNYWPCTFGEEYEFAIKSETNIDTGAKKTLQKCTFVEKTHFSEHLVEVAKTLEKTQGVLTEFYAKIRREKDILDSQYTSSFDYFEFYAIDRVVTQKSPNWADFVSSKVVDAIVKLSKKHNVEDIAAQLDFLFLAKNRYIIDDQIKSLQGIIFDQVISNQNLELIIHLVFAIILVILPFILVGFFILPAIEKLQGERSNILKLLLLVPKSLIWDFVYVTYKEKEEGEDADDEDNQELSDAQKLALSKAKARKMKTDDAIEVINDSKVRLLVITSAALLSVAVPIIVHCAWRYTDNQASQLTIERYRDILVLYSLFSSLRFEAIPIWHPSQNAPPVFAPVWEDYQTASDRIAEKADERLTDDYASDFEISKLLYNPNQLSEVYTSCQDDMITVTPKVPSTYVYKNSIVYEVPARETRCNDKFKTDEVKTPPELALPSDYSVHATRGISILMNYVASNLWELSEAPGSSKNVVEGPVSIKNYWIVEETVSHEGDEAIRYLKKLANQRIKTSRSNTESAFLASYLIGLFYTIILGIWYFRPLINEFSAEIRHNRALFAMVPSEILAGSQPIVEYIERVYSELNDI